MPLFEGGNLLWTLNDKRCVNFKTCGANGDSTTGTAKVRAHKMQNLSTEAARPPEQCGGPFPFSILLYTASNKVCERVVPTSSLPLGR